MFKSIVNLFEGVTRIATAPVEVFADTAQVVTKSTDDKTIAEKISGLIDRFFCEECGAVPEWGASKPPGGCSYDLRFWIYCPHCQTDSSTHERHKFDKFYEASEFVCEKWSPFKSSIYTRDIYHFLNSNKSLPFKRKT